jgi:hypothetical protein
MPSLKCPECKHELLPNDLIFQGDHIICGLCDREIYEKIKPGVEFKCPKCGETGEERTFVIRESCCCSE